MQDMPKMDEMSESNPRLLPRYLFSKKKAPAPNQIIPIAKS
jgi:hypothetical protein